jgi:hypothetical protein
MTVDLIFLLLILNYRNDTYTLVVKKELFGSSQRLILVMGELWKSDYDLIWNEELDMSMITFGEV